MSRTECLALGTPITLVSCGWVCFSSSKSFTGFFSRLVFWFLVGAAFFLSGDTLFVSEAFLLSVFATGVEWETLRDVFPCNVELLPFVVPFRRFCVDEIFETDLSTVSRASSFDCQQQLVVLVMEGTHPAELPVTSLFSRIVLVLASDPLFPSRVSVEKSVEMGEGWHITMFNFDG